MRRPESFQSVLAVYLTGFVLSLMLSVASYLLVTWQLLDGAVAISGALLLLAAIQLGVQAVCFLHLGPDKRPFSRTGTFVFTIVMMLIIVIGSIWIMNSLGYRMHMSPEAMQEYMIEQNKKGF